MFALVDCNAFFVSCEKVFQPRLEGKPIIVLSSNDGCAISRSNEAKNLGIPMGAPLFKIKEIVKRNQVHVFSSNFPLYGNMSSRVMETLKTFSPSLEVYSIDEAFLDLRSVPKSYLFSYGCDIKKIVKKWTGIPVSIGIGPTKTLAKVANNLAKKHPAGCYALLNPEKIEKVLENFPLQNVWGIGSGWSKKLSQFSINTALNLAKMDSHWIRRAFNVILARTALELRGVPCLSLEEISPPKKSLISSRSFGSPITSFEDLREAVSSHASSLAQRLREQRSCASLLSVSLKTNPFDNTGRFYSNTYLVPLVHPSQDTTTLIKAATLALEIIFREGLSYKKVGVMALQLLSEKHIQQPLFNAQNLDNSPKRKSLLKTIDNLNRQHGKGSVIFASEGLQKSWRPKASRLSPCFTQEWDQLVRVG